MKKVIIVGSGLSGLSTAYELVKAGGFDITIIEKESHLGGRTSSWEERGMQIESGFHKFLGFYKHLPKLIKGVGLPLKSVITWEDQIEIRSPLEGNAVFHISPLRRAIRSIWSFLGNAQFIDLKEKYALLRFFTRGIKDYTKHPGMLDSIDILSYARRNGLSRELVHKLIEPLSTGIFFLPLHEFSAFMFFSEIVPYSPRFLVSGAGAFNGGMTEILIDPIGKWLQRNNVEIIKDCEVMKILHKDNQVSGVGLDTKESVFSDFVVLATSIKPAQNLLKEAFHNQYWVQELLKLKSLSAVTVQIETKEAVLQHDHAIFAPGTLLASFAEESHTAFKGDAGRLSLILTPPDKLISLADNKLLALTVRDLAQIGINLKNKVTRFRTTKFASDFYRFVPGAEAHRPVQKTPIVGLYLAGDYTKQKYMSTMEGATFSGKLAAQEIISQFA